MRLFKLLNTAELEKYVLEHYATVADLISLDMDISFRSPSAPMADGTYVFADAIAYHLIEVERGSIRVSKATDDLFDIAYWSLMDITSMSAFESVASDDLSDSEYRAQAYRKWLCLLNRIGGSFRKRGEIEVEEILAINPI